jgi:hypothetical protein
MLRIVRCLRYCSLNQLTICCLFLVFLPLSTATATTEKPSSSTADHSKFEELQQEFESAPEVTKACLGCHTEASKQIHKTLHWKLPKIPMALIFLVVMIKAEPLANLAMV